MKFSFQELIAYIHGLPYYERRLEIKRRSQPGQTRFLYKYRPFDPDSERSIDRVRDILVRSRLWLSSPADFNDPFDMSAKIVTEATVGERRDRFNKILKNQGVRWKERRLVVGDFLKKPRELLEKDLATIFQARIEKIGVHSFAGDPRSILMWSHYAKDHTGICIQFERARDFNTLSGAVPVEYTTDYPESNFINNFHESLGKVLLRKHEGWRYENEQRIVMPSEARKYLHIEPDAVVGIIMGCRISDDGRAQIETLLKERDSAKMLPIRLYMAQQHKSKYKLSIVRSS